MVAIRIDGSPAARRRDGFSMVEVLVSATILVAVVMMLGMIFQQSSVAWRTGLTRSEGYMQIRAFVGALQRDASGMVDSNFIPYALRYNGEKQEFKDGEIRFYTLSGTDVDRMADVSSSDFTSSLCLITYNKDGTREMRRREPSASGAPSWNSTVEKADILMPLNDASDPDKPTVNVRRFAFAFRDSGMERDIDGQVISPNNRYPIYLTVQAEVTQRGRLYEVGAECAGPDRQFGSQPSEKAYKDDIRTWVK
jgi:Tfp pilus assembly protein PilV